MNQNSQLRNNCQNVRVISPLQIQDEIERATSQIVWILFEVQEGQPIKLDLGRISSHKSIFLMSPDNGGGSKFPLAHEKLFNASLD
jgi:hypothetical protein